MAKLLKGQNLIDVVNKKLIAAASEKPESIANYNDAKMLGIKAKQDELEAKFKVPIFPIVCRNGAAEKILAVGYLKKPGIQAQMAYMDLSARSPFSAGEVILDICILKEDSDPRLYTRSDENSEFYLTAVSEAGAMIQMYVNLFKKK